jgi:hypothetical protein
VTILKIKIVLFFFFIFFLAFGCNKLEKEDTAFLFIENDDNVELWENNNLVFGYQKKEKSIDGKFARNNYIHPLMSIEGDTLTEDFPLDHLHHRGIFWAWHQIYIDTLHVSDSWALNNFKSKIVSVENKIINNIAELSTRVFWESPLFNNGEPYVEENTKIVVFPLSSGLRRIDFNITLNALIDGVKIGGSENEKGYGGFSLRIKMPDELVFTSESGKVTPQKLQINAGPWMKFSAPFGKSKKVSSVKLVCGKDSQNYPQPWILRQHRSMQNIVFPGRELVEVLLNKPLKLSYTIYIKETI